MNGDYELLGISHTTSFLDIKKAYAKVLLDSHPNKNGTFDDKKVDKIMGAFKRIMARERNIVEEKRFGETMDIEFPLMNIMCDDMEQKMNELRLNETNDYDTKPYYSKLSYYVRRDGKVFTKIQENANGNLREYEEYKYENNRIKYIPNNLTNS
jgi:hypothetical protein